MKILTYNAYKPLKEIWKHSNSASRMLYSLPYLLLGCFRTGLANFLESFFKDIGTGDELREYQEERETRDANFNRRIQDDEITQEEADTEIAQAFWWTAISELQGAEYCDAPFAAKLREFVSIRQILVS